MAVCLQLPAANCQDRALRKIGSTSRFRQQDFGSCCPDWHALVYKPKWHSHAIKHTNIMTLTCHLPSFQFVGLSFLSDVMGHYLMSKHYVNSLWPWQITVDMDIIHCNFSLSIAFSSWVKTEIERVSKWVRNLTSHSTCRPIDHFRNL